MKIVVLGATGFVGRHLVRVLLDRNHQVTAVARSREKARVLPWYNYVKFIQKDMYTDDYDVQDIAGVADTIADLIWPGLPNYLHRSHFEETLPASYRMLKSLVTAGYRHIMITGTCFEYGLQEGLVSAQDNTRPEMPYAFAKDSLRRSLEFLQREVPFCMQWARLFYVFGEGQNPGSLVPLLDAAVDRGDETFQMTGGEQLRDFITAEATAEQLARLIEQPNLCGCFNICSGQPMSVRRIVEERLKKRGSSIRLEFGHYPYPTYEPMAFWGQPHPELLGTGEGPS